MSDVLEALSRIYGPGWMGDLPHWGTNLVIGVYIVMLMSFAAYALVKARVTPLWSILLLVPYLDVIVLWVIAFIRWPRIDGQRPHVVHRG
jgi:hypothetical protein